MMTMEELSKKVQELADLEEIRTLRFNYWWYLDHKQWDKFQELFTEDLLYTNLATGKQQTKGPWLDGLYGFLHEGTRSSHHGHQQKIEIIDETHATGVWVLRDELYNIRANTIFLGRGWYFDKYRKVDGVWKICELSLAYNMAKGGGNNGYGGDIGPMLSSIGWDIGKQTWDESNQGVLSALEEKGFIL